MKKLLNKIKNYIDQKYLIKYVDNRHWQLADDFDNKVTTLLKEEQVKDLSLYYPDTDLDKEKETNPAQYKFTVHRFTRYIYKISNCTIDPDYNWVILGDKKLFRYSYPLIEDPWDAIKPRPSLAGKLFKKKKVVVDKAILVKYAWNNYYHFLIDTLSQIYLCDDFGIPADVPVIVPYNFGNFSFIADYLKVFPLKRKIIIQEKGTYLDVKELYVAKDVFYNKYIPEINKRIQEKDIAERQPQIHSPKRLFITRKKGSFRSLSNIDEIEQIARDFGFIIAEPGDYTWEQQVKLFSAARYIIGVHGAGLTNIIFCKHPDLSLLEIFPGNGLNPEHYKNISIQLHCKYSSVYGNGLDANAQFHLDKELFRKGIQQLLGQV